MENYRLRGLGVHILSSKLYDALTANMQAYYTTHIIFTFSITRVLDLVHKNPPLKFGLQCSYFKRV
jgi:hypothetical protein